MTNQPFLLLSTNRASGGRGEKFFISDFQNIGELEASKLVADVDRGVIPENIEALIEEADQISGGVKRKGKEILLAVAYTGVGTDSQVTETVKACLKNYLEEWARVHTAVQGVSRSFMVKDPIIQCWEDDLKKRMLKATQLASKKPADKPAAQIDRVTKPLPPKDDEKTHDASGKSSWKLKWAFAAIFLTLGYVYWNPLAASKPGPMPQVPESPKTSQTLVVDGFFANDPWKSLLEKAVTGTKSEIDKIGFLQHMASEFSGDADKHNETGKSVPDCLEILPKYDLWARAILAAWDQPAVLSPPSPPGGWEPVRWEDFSKAFFSGKSLSDVTLFLRGSAGGNEGQVKGEQIQADSTDHNSYRVALFNSGDLKRFLDFDGFSRKTHQKLNKDLPNGFYGKLAEGSTDKAQIQNEIKLQELLLSNAMKTKAKSN